MGTSWIPMNEAQAHRYADELEIEQWEVLPGLTPDHRGQIVARQIAGEGYTLQAAIKTGLPETARRSAEEYVRLRTTMLLMIGPERDGWRRGTAPNEWRLTLRAV